MQKLINSLFLILLLLGAGFFIWQALQLRTADRALGQPADMRLLFIGNSFTGNNNLDQLVARLVDDLNPEGEIVFATSHTPGGYELKDHLQDVENEAEEPRLRRLLITGSEQVRDWDLVMLQNQSQVQGFLNRPLDDALKLAQYAGATSDELLLYMTWGYPEGDPMNPTLYPDYLTMQGKIAQGYNNLAAEISGSGYRVRVAPVGRGFEFIYRLLVQDGQDPLAQDSLFRQLYASDDRHPSLAGSYLAACVITAVYTNQDITQATWKPDELDEEFAAYLRQVAKIVVSGG
ncbi:MAG: hypothetical protein AAF614_41130 [Chloroflexota bacterium]